MIFFFGDNRPIQRMERSLEEQLQTAALLDRAGPGHEVLRWRWIDRTGRERSLIGAFKIDEPGRGPAWARAMGYPGHHGGYWRYLWDDIKAALRRDDIHQGRTLTYLKRQAIDPPFLCGECREVPVSEEDRLCSACETQRQRDDAADLRREDLRRDDQDPHPQQAPRRHPMTGE